MSIEHQIQVAESPILVTDLVSQHGAVEVGDGVAGVKLQHLVEITDGAVVVCYLCTQQATVETGYQVVLL